MVYIAREGKGFGLDCLRKDAILVDNAQYREKIHGGLETCALIIGNAMYRDGKICNAADGVREEEMVF